MNEINEELKKIIEENPIAFATADKSNKPNVIGVAYVKVVASNKLVITDNYMNKTKKNLEENNKVALAVWDNKWNGYQFKGIAEYITSGKWKKFVGNMKENKNLPAKAAVLVTVKEIYKLG